MVLTSASVVSHPSVLYLRRIHRPSYHQPGNSSDSFFSITSSASTGSSFLSSAIVVLLYAITTPPPTRIVSPVMNDASGDAKNTTAPATSSGVPQRLSGVASATDFCVTTSALSAHFVLIHPGATTLTRTLGASSRARHRLIARTPPFAAP